MTRFPLLAAVAAVAVVIASYLALGGLSYEPTPVADPCEQREWRDTGGLQAVAEQIVLAALDGAACELGVSREDLVLAVRDEESLDAFADEHGITRADAERAVEDGIERAFRDADVLDFLGTIGVARILSVTSREPFAPLLGGAVKMLETMAGSLPRKLLLPQAKRLGALRAREAARFLKILRV